MDSEYEKPYRTKPVSFQELLNRQTKEGKETLELLAMSECPHEQGKIKVINRIEED